MTLPLMLEISIVGDTATLPSGDTALKNIYMISLAPIILLGTTVIYKPVRVALPEVTVSPLEVAMQ